MTLNPVDTNVPYNSPYPVETSFGDFDEFPLDDAGREALKNIETDYTAKKAQEDRVYTDATKENIRQRMFGRVKECF